MASELSIDDISFNVTERAHELLDKYSQTHPRIGKSPETAPFKTMKDVFMMAVYLGAQTGRSRPLDGKRATPPFKGGVFNHDEQMHLRAVAIGSTKDPDIMASPQRVVRIVEEYANAGIWELEEIVNTSSEGALWDLADHFARELSDSA